MLPIRSPMPLMEAPADSTQTGGANRRLNRSPTPAPTRVSNTRSQAVSATCETPSTSIALMATSTTNSLTLTQRPISSEVKIVRPRLHQLSPTRELNPLAMSTPTMTEFTRRIPVVSVA